MRIQQQTTHRGLRRSTFGVATILAATTVSWLAAQTPPEKPAEKAATIQVEIPVLPSPSLGKDAEEKQILAVIDDIVANQSARMMNVPREDGRLLRVLAESIGAKNVVEIGTSNGFSGLWFSLALRKTGGHLTTHDIDPGRIAKAKENFQRAGVEGLVTIVAGDAHQTVLQLKDPIDLLFIDADKPGYPDYLKKLLPLVRPGGLVIAHNMRRPAPSPEYIQAITSSPELESLFLNMHDAGIAVSLKKR